MPLPIAAAVGLGMRLMLNAPSPCRWLATVVACLAVLYGGGAVAATDTMPGTWRASGYEAATAAEACEAWRPSTYPTWTFVSTVSNGGSAPTRSVFCRFRSPAGAESNLTTANEFCSAAVTPPWTANTTLGLCVRTVTACPAGKIENASTHFCEVPNACNTRAGQSEKKNFTVGWARTSNPDDLTSFVIVPRPGLLGSVACVNGCEVSVGNSVSDSWRSQTPASNGLHRHSVDVLVTFSGATCTSSTAEADPTTVVPPCPGTLGAVNGRPVCFGTASSPLPAASAPASMPPSGAGNPAAGDIPTTGPGSGATGAGRTPLVGNGGNNGGGSNAAVPGGGSEGNGQSGNSGSASGGTPDRPADPCGLPGRPPCKIDETGTPDGSNAYNGAKTAWDTAAQSELDAFNSSGRKVNAAPWMWGFGVPTGVCSPLTFEFRGRTMGFDPCTSPLVAIIRTALSWFVSLCAAVYIWRSLTSSVPAGGK